MGRFFAKFASMRFGTLYDESKFKNVFYVNIVVVMLFTYNTNPVCSWFHTFGTSWCNKIDKENDKDIYTIKISMGQKTELEEQQDGGGEDVGGEVIVRGQYIRTWRTSVYTEQGTFIFTLYKKKKKKIYIYIFLSM